MPAQYRAHVAIAQPAGEVKQHAAGSANQVFIELHRFGSAGLVLKPKLQLAREIGRMVLP